MTIRKMSVSFPVVCSVELGAVDRWTNLNSPAVLWLGGKAVNQYIKKKKTLINIASSDKK